MTDLRIRDFETTGRVFIIAEIAQAHEGSLGILHSFIDACAQTGANALKVQIHIAEAESSPDEPFRTRFSYVDDTRYDYWKRMSFTEDQWIEVKRHCDDKNIEFLATPFSVAAVDLLERLEVSRYKVGSGDINNGLLLERIAATGKEAILSTGLGTKNEILAAVSALKSTGVSVLQCTTKYPTAAEDVGLSAIEEIRSSFDCPAGLSDHSGTIYPGIAAAALGASIVEAHATFDRRMFGPDAKSSLTIDEFAELVKGIRFVEKARAGSLGKKLDDDTTTLRAMFGRSLAVNKDLEAGHILQLTDLESKKPAGKGVSANEYKSIVGRKLKKSVNKWAFLTNSDVL